MKFCCRQYESSICARFAKPINDEDIMKKTQNSTPANTLKQMQWAIRVWGSWRLNCITVAKDESDCPPMLVNMTTKMKKPQNITPSKNEVKLSQVHSTIKKNNKPQNI